MAEILSKCFGNVVPILLLLICFVTSADHYSNERDPRQIHHTRTPIPSHTTTSPKDPLTSWMEAAATEKPNVLFLVVDDLRPKLGCYGESNMVTPNIDQLASRSIVFNRAYVQQATCGPSRTSFLTGRRPDTTRVLDLVTYWRTVAGNFTTIPQHFKNHGYITQSVGKIFHQGVSSGDNFDGPYSWTEPHYTGYPELEPETNETEYHRTSILAVDEAVEGKLQDTDVADFTVQWLQNHTQSSQQPFFLAVGFHKPHLPFRFPKQYLDLYPLSSVQLARHRTKPPELPAVAWSNYGELRKFRDIIALNVGKPYGPIPEFYQYKLRQAYSAATSYADAMVGRVLEALEQNGLTDNTIIVFLGDHGWQLGENGEWSKHTNFEIAVRMPLMLHVPGVTSPTGPGVTSPTGPGVTSPTGPGVTSPTGAGRIFPLIDTLASLSGLHTPSGSHLQLTDALVEAVDIFPTLSELAGLTVPDTCPEDSRHVRTCTEGTSLVPILRNTVGDSSGGDIPWKDAAYSQFHRNLHSNSPIMGYTVRTKTHRYTEWVAYDKVNYRGNFSHVHARELYVEASDPDEHMNVAEVTSYSDVVKEMSQLLRQGWRYTLEQYKNQ